MQRLPSLSSLLTALALLFVGYATYLGSPNGFPVSAMTCCVTAVVLLCTALSFAAGQRVWLRCGIAATLVAGMAAVVGSSVIQMQQLSYDPYYDPRYAAFLTGLLVLLVAGIWRGWFVARWLGMGLAGAGILSAGLNFIPVATLRGEFAWSIAINIAGALLVVANLWPAAVRERFERGAAPVWTSSDPMLRSIRHTVMAFLGALPMLLVYGWMQPVVASTSTTAVALAVFLLVAVGLTLSRRVIGAALLALGGVALIAQAAMTTTMAYADSAWAGKISLYYAAFWIPAGLVALVCGARLIGPTIRLLRNG